MKTILVTGGAGFVGSHACKALARAGYLPVTPGRGCATTRTGRARLSLRPPDGMGSPRPAPAAGKRSRRADAEREDDAGDALYQEEHAEHQRHRERGPDGR